MDTIIGRSVQVFLSFVVRNSFLIYSKLLWYTWTYFYIGDVMRYSHWLYPWQRGVYIYNTFIRVDLRTITIQIFTRYYNSILIYNSDQSCTLKTTKCVTYWNTDGVNRIRWYFMVSAVTLLLIEQKWLKTSHPSMSDEQVYSISSLFKLRFFFCWFLMCYNISCGPL